eukprot:CAMPEP_0181343146 /NCGR_PEP_ID=MMETSP1101-20121128/31423_1 /TAXON_ID=46948 /ORGANISM="Rhodomonas abbreviata, Strain Caron Lab Isolate" /LENGTH=191 /DNA_ID=CAMNT_0023454741 /DNA_START=71 /DNA_END=642 /DNA_ORIENTATION=+
MTKFGDVQKKSGDLLSREYFFDKKFKLTSKASNGVKFTTEGCLAPKSASGSLSASFGTSLKGLTVDKLAVTTAGRFKGEASLSDALPGTKLVIKGEDGGGKNPSGKLDVQYTKDALRVDTSLDFTDGPTVHTAATYGYKQYLVGAELKYNTMLDDKGSPAVEDYNAVLGYTQADVSASVKTANKAQVFKFA